MKSVIKYELLSYFTNIPAYVFGVFLLIFLAFVTFRLHIDVHPDFVQ